jgi:hypothetical protein
MQIRLFPALLLFLASYFPLALILAVQDIDEEEWSRPACMALDFWDKCVFPKLSHPALILAFLSISFISLVFLIWLLDYFKGSTEVKIEESKSVPNDLINYVFPYIVSFMGLQLSDAGKVVGLIIFMSWLFLISYRSGQILMNPLLLALGWQLYEVKADIEGNKRVLRALSRDPVVPATTLSSCVVQGIYVLSKTEKK